MSPKKIREAGNYANLAFPDATGARGGSAVTRQLSIKGPDFPYDDTNPDHSYGQPRAYDRGTSGDEPDHHAGITPKDTSHSVWDEIGEAMGVPSNIAMADRGGGLTATPGKGPGAKPIKPWDDDTVDDETLSRYGESSELDFPGMVDDPEESKNSDKSRFDGSPFESEIMTFVGSGFQNGLGQHMARSRGVLSLADSINDILGNRSTWSFLENIVNLGKNRPR